MASGEDDLSMLGCDYEIIDERLAQLERVSTASFVPSTPPSTALPVTFIDDQNAATTFVSFPDGYSTTQRPAAKTPTRTEHIGFFFHRHRADVFKKYDEYRSGTALTFKNINIYDFFNEIELGKAAVYLLRENVEPELQNAAFYVILNVTMDLIEIITPRLDLPRPAPSILALGAYPEVTFWIAVDNVPLRVPGSFADALQSFMEVTWLFNLKYDVKTQAFVRFFEILMGYSKSVSTSRMQLLQQLMDLKIIISQRNSKPSSTTSPTHQSPNVPCSNDLANNSNSDLQL